MSEVVHQWHPDVVDDFRELPKDLRAAYLEQIEALRADPKLGEHLDRRASTGDLSVYRKLKFGRDTRFRVIAVRSRADVYDIAAQRLVE